MGGKYGSGWEGGGADIVVGQFVRNGVRREGVSREGEIG